MKLSEPIAHYPGMVLLNFGDNPLINKEVLIVKTVPSKKDGAREITTGEGIFQQWGQR